MRLDGIPIGIYEKALPSKTGWYERLSLAKKAGYDFVEISIDESDERLSRLDWGSKERAKLCSAISNSGITIPSMCLSGHRRFPIGSESNETRQMGLDIMKKSIAFAVDTGIRIIQLAGYDVYYEKSNEKTKHLFKESLLKSLEWASKAGVTLAIETMDCEFMNSITKIMNYVNEFNSPWLHVYPDIGNLSAWEQNIESELEISKGHLVAVHVKETVPGKFRRVPFGEGTVPFTKAFRKLKNLGFKGPLLIEMWTDDSPDLYEIIVDALSWVKDRMKEAELY